jgi:hypothetical protein
MPQITPEILTEWIWLKKNQRTNPDEPDSDEWSRRWKKFNNDIRFYWSDFAGPLEADTEIPNVHRQPHRAESWQRARAWRQALEAAELRHEASS